MEAQQEQHSEDDWGGIRHLFSLVRAYPFMFAALLAFCTIAGFVAATSVGPKHESSIYLGLEDWRERNPVLEGLAIPGGTQDTKDAYSVLRSQEVLALVVSGPDAGPESFRLGLQTEVLELPLSAWQRLRAKWKKLPRNGEFKADFLPLDPTESQPTKTAKHADWSVYFDSESTAWIAPFSESHGTIKRVFGTGLGPQAQQIQFSPGDVVPFGDRSVRISTTHGMTGRTFRVRSRTEEQAIAGLRRALNLQIPGDRNQVLRLVVRDSQAYRAKDLTVALTAAFLHHEKTRNQNGAESVVSYLDGQLEQRKAELAEIDQSIAQRRNENTDLLHPEQSMGYLQSKRLQVLSDSERTTEQIQALKKVHADLQEKRYDSVANVRKILTDPRFGRWLDRIDQIDGELGLGSQRDSDLLRKELERDLTDAQAALRHARRQAENFDRHLRAFADGEDGRLSAMLEILTDAGAPPPTSLVDTEVRPYNKAQLELQNILERYTEKHPAVETARAWVQTQRESLRGALDGQLQVLQDAIGARAEDAQLLNAEAISWPQQKQVELGQAKVALWAKVRTAVRTELDRARTLSVALKNQLEGLEDRRLRLPADQNALELPLLEREGLHAKIDKLITKREDAEVALAGLRPTARILEPAEDAKPLQTHLTLLGSLIGILIGVLCSLTCAQFRSTRKPHGKAAKATKENMNLGFADLDLPLLARMPSRAGDHLFAQGHPLQPDMKGMAFASLRRLRVQLNLHSEKGWDTGLLGVIGLDDGIEEPLPKGAHWQPVGKPNQALPTIASATVGGLALTHVLAGKHVAIIDACPGASNLSASLGLKKYPGLLECLAGEAQWKQCLVTAGPSRLEILPAGNGAANLITHFSQPGWKTLLSEMQERYDVVLLKLPSLGEPNNLQDLTPQLGGVLVVADTRHMPVGDELARLLSPLRSTGTQLIGLFQANRGRAKQDSATEAA